MDDSKCGSFYGPLFDEPGDGAPRSTNMSQDRPRSVPPQDCTKPTFQWYMPPSTAPKKCTTATGSTHIYMSIGCANDRFDRRVDLSGNNTWEGIGRPLIWCQSPRWTEKWHSWFSGRPVLQLRHLEVLNNPASSDAVSCAFPGAHHLALCRTDVFSNSSNLMLPRLSIQYPTAGGGRTQQHEE